MIEDDLLISNPLSDTDKQAISYKLFQMMKFKHSVYTNNETIGELRLHNIEPDVVIFTLKLYRQNLFKTRCDLYDKHFKQLHSVIFDRTFFDISNSEFKNIMAELLNLLMENF